MRGFLIFLAFATPLVLFNPLFWWIVESYTGAAPSMIVEADGAVRESFIGPRSPWPDWPLVPEGAKVTPVSSYGRAPGHPAMGHGAMAFDEAPKPMIDRLTDALKARGWRVEAMRYRVAEPSLPPRYLTICTLTARRSQANGDQTVMYGFQLDPALDGASVHWREGAPLPSWPRFETLPAWTEPQPHC